MFHNDTIAATVSCVTCIASLMLQVAYLDLLKGGWDQDDKQDPCCICLKFSQENIGNLTEAAGKIDVMQVKLIILALFGHTIELLDYSQLIIFQI